MLSRGSGYMQSVFYSLIQSGKNRFNAAFCVGTNVVFRRNAVADIGGIYQESKSEDIWTSIHLHERGWRSIYTGAVLAVGDTPESVEAYSKQQLRWATGAFEILLRHNPLSRKRNLTTDQRIQYLTTATFYLNGIAPALLLMVPPLQIYFDLTPVALGRAHEHLADVLRRLLLHADRGGALHHGLLPLGDADARLGVLPDLHPGDVERHHPARAAVARHRSRGRGPTPRSTTPSRRCWSSCSCC